jgi:hypothetical protein
MGELILTLPNGTALTFMQATALARRLDEFGSDNSHWHLNDCRCCLTIHRNEPPMAVVITSEGEEFEYPGSRCGCDHTVTGQTDVKHEH